LKSWSAKQLGHAHLGIRTSKHRVLVVKSHGTGDRMSQSAISRFLCNRTGSHTSDTAVTTWRACVRQTHDCIRNGTTSLFAALDVVTGKVIGSCHRRHRHQEFLRFLERIDEAVPEQLAA
jgi:hypothetical protein